MMGKNKMIKYDDKSNEIYMRTFYLLIVMEGNGDKRVVNMTVLKEAVRREKRWTMEVIYVT